ncbi:pentatricopeptide repeat-containing protein At2g35030, mitochondrial-like [Selaginella moellendorffii]|uniref:pentatricopeptide repeat-containing protein At2g35030, mitochondrial-like n=1 Tax=Selaginella moellendorffii TaxID=88036 RepID=UPI000D1CABE9|nr:pentatricopeptide repeat-containing protein At2g35030, mitochondrial-like [Selaginella moellendorffii]|eukprot:XP_024539088.1 pentatricopeptide repeat-containing protein At2g35030, mitochondrial-like [Selaginella moellendorffii]
MEAKSLVSWNIMLAAMAKKNQLVETTEFFNQVPEKDDYSWTILLGAYGEVDEARRIFYGLKVANVVTLNTMVQGYAQNGQLNRAREMFDGIPRDTKSAASWNVMISAYGKAGRLQEAEEMFESMPKELRNQITWNSMMKELVRNGRLVHAKNVFNTCPRKMLFLGRVYSRHCVGEKESLAKALKVLEEMPHDKTVVHWTMMLEVYSNTGDVDSARAMFDRMDEPDVASVNAICPKRPSSISS